MPASPLRLVYSKDRQSAEPGAKLQYDDNQDFNDFLDEEPEVGFPFVVIAFKRSVILYEMDKVAYGDALSNYRDKQVEDFKELVLDEFPTPIAYHFHRFHNRATGDAQRLGILKDIWESAALLVHAIVVGEFRWLNASLSTTKISADLMRSDRIRDKLWVIDKLLAFANDMDFDKGDLICLRIVAQGVTDTLRELNDERNTFWHAETPSDDEARPLIAEFYPQVISLLKAVQELQSINLLRFVSQAGTTVTCEMFGSFTTTTSNREYKLSNDQLVKWAPYCTRDLILLEAQGTVFSLTPFLHHGSDQQGHSTKLCFYKKREGVQPPERPVIQWVYQVVGETRPVKLADTEISPYFSAIEALL